MLLWMTLLSVIHSEECMKNAIIIVLYIAIDYWCHHSLLMCFYLEIE